MITFKCKMCGGDLHPVENATTCECDYCGSVQTIPTADNEKKLNLFVRAQRLLRSCEFDKAAGVYESIVAEFPEEAEAYWGLVLCKYGIEYVDDPGTGKKVPTCHRTSFDIVMDDANFDQVMENSDVVARKVYRDEAKAIEELRKGIIEVSGKEQPYDIFICYKETDEKGDRTLDSVLAQDIYNELTEKGYRVFFSRITLEDKLGQEYEPYIFAALNSAKVMLAVGTDYEYFNAVWVKNEWSRFLKLIASGEKKTLIPCYKGVDAYDMPKEFARLQAQDMGKVGAMQDLLRGIEKIIIPKMNAKSEMAEPTYSIPSEENILQRAYMYLEDSNWGKAKEYYIQVLDRNPQCAKAFLGLAMIDLKCSSQSDFEKAFSESGDCNSVSIRRANQFAEGHLHEWLESLIDKRMKTIDSKEIQLKEARKRNKQVSSFIQAHYGMIFCVTLTGNIIVPGLEYYCEPSFGGFTKQSIKQLCDMNNVDILRLDLGGRVAIRKNDGSVYYNCIGDKADFHTENRWRKWTDIVDVEIVGEDTADGYQDYIYALKSDGTIEYEFNSKARIEKEALVREWNNITKLRKFGYYVFGITQDGRIYTNNREIKIMISNWYDIEDVFFTSFYGVGLKKDGTVVANFNNAIYDNLYSPYEGYKKDYIREKDLDVTDWNSIVALVGNSEVLCGLRNDGSVLMIDPSGKYSEGREWTDIIQLVATPYYILGLRVDGRVVLAGERNEYTAGIQNWEDVAYLCSRTTTTAALKKDGKLLLTGKHQWQLEQPFAKQEIEQIKLFSDINTLEQQRAAIIAEQEQKRREERIRKEKLEEERQERDKKEREEEKKRLLSERDYLIGERANLKGLFSGRRRKEIERRLSEIDGELREL